jgi:hypothetical protein
MNARKLCAVHTMEARESREGASNNVGSNPKKQNGCANRPSGSNGSISNCSPPLELSVDLTSWIQPNAAR